MAKTYTVHYSAKYAAAGSSASATALYGQANPEGIYPAGIYQNKTRAVVCLFSGLSGITASRVTGITLHLQRLAGGSNITYSVNLTHSVLSEPLGISGTSFTLRRGQPIFTDNDEQWQWVGHDTDVGGEYQTISIPAGLFAQLRDYGWAITYRTSSHARSIFVGDVYLSVTTSETDYTLTYNANGGSGAPGRQTGTGVGSHTFTISGTKPTRAGHTFLGWSLSSTATSASYQPGGSITLTASATLYAVWRINTYTRQLQRQRRAAARRQARPRPMAHRSRSRLRSPRARATRSSAGTRRRTAAAQATPRAAATRPTPPRRSTRSGRPTPMP